MWSLGFIVGLVVTSLLVVCCLAAVVFGVVAARHDGELGAWFIVPGALVLAVTLGLALSPLGFYPYEKPYHYWTPVAGTVAAISHRVVNDGDGVEQKYVVRLDGDGTAYGIEDTRASLLHRGDTVRLLCIRSWQYASTPGYDCRWNQP